MESAGSSATYLSTNPYGVTSQKPRNLHVHHHEDLIYLKNKFEEFVTGALTVLVQVWLTNFILLGLDSARACNFPTCHASFERCLLLCYAVNYILRIPVCGRAESCHVTPPWTTHPSLLMNGTVLQGAYNSVPWLPYGVTNTGISYESVLNANGKQLGKMIRQKLYVMELNCDQIIFDMLCRDGWHVVTAISAWTTILLWWEVHPHLRIRPVYLTAVPV